MKSLLTAILLLTVALLAATLLWRIWPDIRPASIGQSEIDLNDAALIEQGRYLTTAGNCVACHTRQGGAAFAGGRRIRTPFGDVVSSNLTPHPDSGLGRWTTADFWGAMHHGRSRDGRLLYPAFPYASYSRVTRADSDAIFAYLHSLEPVATPVWSPDLRFPYNLKVSLMLWRGLFFEPEAFRPDPERSAEWNRGAYLVEGLGHCSACHTARGALGQTLESADYAGGRIPGLQWTAPPLAGPAPMSPARAEELVELLHTGVSARNATTGPMAEVVFHSLQHLQPADIRAMVEYLRALPTTPTVSERSGLRVPAEEAERLTQLGARLYGEHCESCHGDNGMGEPRRYPALAGNPLVISPSVSNVIRSVLEGGFAPSTQANPRPYGMPSYAQAFSAEQTAAVITYIRQAWGNQAAPVSPLDINRR